MRKIENDFIADDDKIFILKNDFGYIDELSGEYIPPGKYYRISPAKSIRETHKFLELYEEVSSKELEERINIYRERLTTEEEE